MPDTVLVKDGFQCFVFANHESDTTISESCYRTWFNGNKVDPRIVWVGYSETVDSGSADNDTFLCNGKRVYFSRKLFYETKKKFTMLPPSGKGHIQIVIMKIENGRIIDRETYGRTLGSNKTSVIDELTNISNSIKTGYFVEKNISRKAAIIGLSILLLVSSILFLVLTTISLMFGDKGIVALLLIRGAIILPPILLIAYFLYKSIKWKEFEKTDKFDFDVAMLISFIPAGFGLLYLHKWFKGLLILILFVIFTSIFFISITRDVVDSLTSTLAIASLIWMLLSWFTSLIETEYECFQIGMNNNFFSTNRIKKIDMIRFSTIGCVCSAFILYYNFSIYSFLAFLATSPFVIYCYYRYKSM